MGSTTTLYAWASPVSGWRGADHTWVTTYASPYGCPPPRDYWYCWGLCCEAGPGSRTRLLWAGQADYRMASCLCEPNRPGSTGGVHRYGVEGMSHQVANRILYASSPFGTAMTVQGAHMYWLSHLLYGTYGTNRDDWEDLRRRCCGAKAASLGDDTGDAALRQVVRSMLGSAYRPETAQELDRLRDDLRSEKAPLDRAVCEGGLDGEEFADAANRLVSSHVPRLAELLGTENVRRIFDVTAGEHVELLDPFLAGRCDYKARRAEAC